MKKALTLVILILLFSSTLALTPEQALEKYYSSAASEDIEAYLAVTDFTGMSQEEIENERALVEELWNMVDEQKTSIGNIEKAMTEDAHETLLQYELTSSFKNTNTGETTSFEDLEHVALLSNESGDWKVVYALPLDYYLEAREGAERIALTESYVDDIIEDIATTPEDTQKLLVNGVPYTGPPTTGGIFAGIINVLDMAIGLVGILIAIVVLLIIVFSVKNLVTKPAEKKMEKTPAKEKPGKEITKTEPAPVSKKEFSEAMKVLRKRYAAGEISKEEFNEMKKELEI